MKVALWFHLRAAVIVVPLVACTHSSATAPPILPLRKIRFYETGVAYFERTGQLTAPGATRIPVPETHLDDALKSLVILTGRGGTVRNVEFDSLVTPGLARALAKLPSPSAKETLTYPDLLQVLKGAQVEVKTQNGEKISGQLLDIHRAVTQKSDNNADEETSSSEPKADAKVKATTHAPNPHEGVLLLLSSANELRRFELATLHYVRPTDPEMASRLASTLSAVAANHGGSKSLTVLTSSPGPITLGYLAEAPLLRITYRLVLAGAKTATLQGWALVHNDTEEPWANVQLEFASGKPDSFLFPFAAPRYARRELKTPDETWSTVPQLFRSTADGKWQDGEEEGEGSEGSGVGGVETTGHGSSSGAVGLGQVRESQDTMADDSAASSQLASVVEAIGRESGSQFLYRFGQPIHLSSHRSTLVPFLMRAVGGESMSCVTLSSHQELEKETSLSASATTHLWNSSNVTLPPGLMAIFSDGGLAGETTLSTRLKPQQHVFLDHGEDRDVSIKVRVTTDDRTPTQVGFRADHFEEHFTHRRVLKLGVNNLAGADRHVCLRLQTSNNVTLRAGGTLGYDSEHNVPIVITPAPARKLSQQELDFSEKLITRTKVKNLEATDLERIVQASGLSVREKTVVQRVLAEVSERDKKREELGSIVDKVKDKKEDIERLRKNLQAAAQPASVDEKAGEDETDSDETPKKKPMTKATPHAGASFASRLAKAEDKLTQLKKRTETLEKEGKDVTEKIRQILKGLNE